VQVRDDDRIDTRWVLVFGAQNGAIYAIDALGDGVNGTRRGETKLYWILKPPGSAPFSYASPLLLENRNKVVIGNLAGTVYFIPTDFDPNAPPDELNENLRKWTFYRSGAAFVSTPAYSPETGLVYIGAAEGAAQFGRLFAFKPTVLDNPDTPEDERIAWVYPRDDAPQRRGSGGERRHLDACCVGTARLLYDFHAQSRANLRRERAHRRAGMALPARAHR